MRIRPAAVRIRDSSPVRGYGLALVLTGGAFWPIVVIPFLQARPYVTCFAAVILSAWLGGFRPALLSILVSVVAVNIYRAVSLPPEEWDPLVQVGQSVIYVTIAIIVAWSARARELSEREARRQGARLEAMFGQASIGIALVSLDGRLMRVNHRMAQIIGRSVEESEGLTYEQLTHPDDWSANADRMRAIAAGTGQEFATDQRYLRPDGSAVWVHVSVAPMVDADSRPDGLIATVEDVSERHSAEMQLRESEERARLALEIAQLGTLTWLADGNQVLADQRCREICDLPASGPIALADIYARIHRDDRDHVERTLAHAAQHAHSYAEEFRFVHRDGSVRWVIARGDAVSRSGAASGPVRVLLGSMMDVTERRSAEEALRQADREKDDFLALLAHELRNPLAPIRTAVQLLTMRPQPAAEGQRLYAVIDRQVQHLVRMVDDLLDVSRVLRGKVQLRREPVPIADAIAIAVETSRPLIDLQRQHLVLELPDHSVSVDGDQVRLAQVIANLLNNASKYSDTGGTIRVAVSRSGADVVIEVSDEGAGISPEMLPRIFEPFVQADRSLERSRGGLGIGLTLVKKIVEMHHGHVSVTSRGLGLGTTFSVRLAAHVEVAAAAAAIGPAASRPSIDGAPSRILVVDDNVDAAESLAMLLATEGHTVTVAHNGRDAVDRTDTWRPDVVVLDIGLPGMNGYEAARALRQRGERCPDLIAVTGYGQASDAQRAFEAGFQYHLVKPVDAGELMSTIARCHAARNVDSKR
jgi:PAS domain S-box-containing protein